MKQVHEKFKVFSSREAADKFLSDGNINAKSISFMLNDNYEALVIGYVESKKTHHYHLEEEEILDISFIGLERAMEKAEELAAEHDGVICQDMQVINNSLIIFFLVATKETEDEEK